MLTLVTAAEMRLCEDEILNREPALTSLALMERAARAASEELEHRVARSSRILVVCGGGNNGGDGLAMLRMLCADGYDASAVLLAEETRLSASNAAQLLNARACGCTVERAEALTNAVRAADWIVDAIFGIGLARPVSGAYAEAVAAINVSKAHVFAVDIPSGVDADTGAALGCAVCAEVTVTFQYLKRGLVLYPGKSFAGETVVRAIRTCGGEASHAYLTERADIAALLPERPRDSHKGKNGHALLLAGSGAYTGAALLSAAAALRAGCGILTVGAPKPVKDAFPALPEAICRKVTDSDGWDAEALQNAGALLAGKSAVGMGSGMGKLTNDSLIEAILSSGLPCVLDADALNHLAEHPELLCRLHRNVLLTPHPGEMARLMHSTVSDVTRDPVETARKSAALFGCAILLKGTVSCIAADGNVYLNDTGNAGLAKGGSGDVLTGIVTGLLAQGLNALNAARAGAYLLGASAEEAFQLLGTRMLMAGDVIDAIAATVRQM